MTISGKYRSFSSLALLRLSESDLRSFHELVREMSPSTFVELIRDTEDEIENSMAFTLNRYSEQAFSRHDSRELHREIDLIRKKEIQVPVNAFADMLYESLLKTVPSDAGEVPRFDSRRGLQSWINKLANIFSEQAVYHAVMQIRHDRSDMKESDWKLR